MPGFRFSPLNRVRCVTTSTGTGDMVIGSTSPGYQSFLNLDDGAVVPYWAQYGSQWECGLATKSGGSLERTTILESTNGNSAVEWADGTTKNIAIDWLANNVVDCVDESISVVDDILTGKTLISGLSIGAVVTWFKTFALEGVDISITYNGTTSGTFANLRKIHVDQDTPGASLSGPFDLTLDFAADVGSSHIVTIESHRLLHFENISPGQDVIVHLKYEAFEDHKHKVTWPNDLDEPECEIEWVNGYNPAFSPVVGCSDTFKFERIDDGEGVPKYLGWILSRERPVIVDGSATGGVVVTMSTVTNGAAKGPNAQQWLSVTVDSDSMRYTLNRTGTVNGGTFDLTIGLAPNQNFTIENIPYDVTAYDLLLLIWDQTSLTPGDINVDGGLLGADSLDKLTDSPGSIHLEFIGKSRYAGYVISVDDTNLTGGGSYDTEAVGQGSGSQAWPFTNNSTNSGPIVFTFNGYQTSNLAINSSDAQIQTALETLPGIGEDNIRVTSYGVGVYCFEFVGDLRSTDIPHEIQLVPGYWPKSNLGEPTGQRYSTTVKGAGPSGNNEVQRLAISANPIQGNVILTILGHDVHIPVVSTLTEIQALLNTALGSGVVVATGGPLPSFAVDIEFVGDEGFKNQPLCSVDGTGAGSEDIDWSICNGKRITLRPSNGTVLLNHVNVIEGETLHVTVKNSPTSIPATVETIQDGSPGDGNEIVYLVAADNLNERFQLRHVPAGSIIGGTFDFVTILGRVSNLAWDITLGDFLNRVSDILDDGNPCLSQIPWNAINGVASVPLHLLSARLIDCCGEGSQDNTNLALMGIGRLGNRQLPAAYGGFLVDNTHLIGGILQSIGVTNIGDAGHVLTGSYRVRVGSSSHLSSPISVSANATQIKNALEALPEIGAGNLDVQVCHPIDGSDGPGVVRLEFKGSLTGDNIAPLNIDVGNLAIDAFNPSSARAPVLIAAYTQQNGDGGNNETHRLTLSDSTPGDVIVEMIGKTVTIPRTSTNNQIRTLIQEASGAVVTITGGPLTSDFIDITFDTAPFNRKDLPDSLIMYASSGPIQWGGVPIDWGTFDPPDVPLSGGSIYLEFYGETTELILGKKWHHVESGGGEGGILADQLLPGISIEITHDVLADTFEFDNLERREILDDAATIICDGVAGKGVDKEVTITADRDIDANNFKLGETLRLKITQGTTGNWKVNYLFDIEWQEGFEPVLTTVPGKSDCFEMRCIRERGPYQVPAFKAWVETTERPQPIEFVSNPAALNEIQEVTSDTVPTGGVWVLTYQGIPTSDIPYNATHSAIQTILETHPYIGSGNVEVSGGLLGVNPILIEFVGSLAHQNLSEMSLQFGGLLF